MNPYATAEASTSTLSGASVKTAERNDFMNIGHDMVKFENVNLTINTHCATGDGASEVREDATSSPIATTNVFVTLATLLKRGGIFGRKASDTHHISSGNTPQQSAPDDGARDQMEPKASVTEIQDMTASPPLSVLDTIISESTVSPLTQSSSAERYIRSLLECNQGYPLYEPEPESQYCQEGVRVGDVGLITEDGGFDFMFNVCPPSDTNPDELPDDFEMLRTPEILVKTHFQSDTRLFNKGVKRTEEPDVKYTCSGPEGSILELPLGATRFEAKNKRSFKRLTTRHAENWYRYTMLTRDRDAPNGSLYIVTSCIKCTDWGIAVFDRPSNDQDYLRFVTNEDIEENQNEQSQYRWKGSGAYIAKVALNGGSAGSDDADGPNQCVFLRGYKIMLRKDIWDNITNSQLNETYVRASPYSPHLGNESERQGDSSNQDNPSHRRDDNSSGSDCGTTRAVQNPCSRTDTSARVILYECSKTSLVHPSDLINTILLYQEHNAKVALTHDDEWCDLLQYHSQIVLDSDPFSKVSLPYVSHIDEYGCVSLKRSDLSPSPDATVVGSNSDTGLTSSCPPIVNTRTIPTHKLPSISHGLALLQQDYLYPFSATTWQSPISYSYSSLTTATVESDVKSAVSRKAVGLDADVRSLLPFDSFFKSSGAATKLQDSFSGSVSWPQEAPEPLPPGQLRHLPTCTQVLDNGFKRYQCGCGHQTRNIGDMKRHHKSLVHSSQRKHVCSCGKSFISKDNLTRHIKMSGRGHHQLSNATNLFSIHSQTGHHISSTTATVGGDVNRTFARDSDMGAESADAGEMSLPPSDPFMLGRAGISAATMLLDLPTPYIAKHGLRSVFRDPGQPFNAISGASTTSHSQFSHHSTTATGRSDPNLDESMDCSPEIW